MRRTFLLLAFLAFGGRALAADSVRKTDEPPIPQEIVSLKVESASFSPS